MNWGCHGDENQVPAEEIRGKRKEKETKEKEK